MLKQKNNSLLDIYAREQFETRLNSSFSVIAPAGVGKTTAIVNRLLNIVLTAIETQVNPFKSLLVVTYTQKAALELQTRLSNLLETGFTYISYQPILASMWFGTIHGFAFELIQKHHALLRLPPILRVVTNEDVWPKFINHTSDLYGVIDSQLAQSIRKYIPLRKILDLAAKIDPVDNNHMISMHPPMIDMTAIYNFKPDKRSEQTIAEQYSILKAWEVHQADDSIGIGVPMCLKGGAAFKALWEDTFESLRQWLTQAASLFASKLAIRYLDFKRVHGFVTYADIIRLANTLTKNPLASHLLQNEAYTVILDEAQDTDHTQFDMLLALTQSQPKHLDPNYRICMVGDPQQSIYGSRSRVDDYLNIHNHITKDGVALTFNVTMRCSQGIIDYVNAMFPCAFRIQNVPFVPLQAKPEVTQGHVYRISVPAIEVESMDKAQADHVIRMLHTLGLKGLGISNWENLAIICPRKQWLNLFQKALQECLIPVQVHSHSLLWADHPVYAWLTGLIYIMEYPFDSLEICGVLRELLGISDHAIATFVRTRLDEVEGLRNTQIHPLNIAFISDELDVVGTVLNDLCSIRAHMIELPLYSAISYLLKAVNFIERAAFLETEYAHVNVLDTCEHFKALAAKAQAEGLTLNVFVAQLKLQLEQPQDEMPTQVGCVQLYTCHKAKGLEWDTVVIPFMFKSISMPPIEYPMIYKPSNTQESIVILDASGYTDTIKVSVQESFEQELVRLAYVACTRAKRQLILVDDSSCYKKPSKNSFAEVLKLYPNAENCDVWNKLPTLM